MGQENAVKMVKDALAQGKTESEIVAFMKEAGYSDSDIVHIMAATKEAHPTDTKVQQIGRATLQQTNLRPSPQPPMQSNLSASDILKLWIGVLIHPKLTADKLKGNVGFLHGLLFVAIGGIIAIALLLLLLYAISNITATGSSGASSGSTTAIAAVLPGVSFNISLENLTPIVELLAIIIIGWLLWSGISWGIGKALHGEASLSNYIGSTGFAYSILTILGIIAFIGIAILVGWVIQTIVASLVSSLMGTPAAGFDLISSLAQFGIVLLVMALVIYSQFIMFFFIRDLMGFSDERAVWVLIFSAMGTVVAVVLIQRALNALGLA